MARWCPRCGLTIDVERKLPNGETRTVKRPNAEAYRAQRERREARRAKRLKARKAVSVDG